MPDVTIKSEDVANLVRAIRKHADSKAFRGELRHALNSATKPVRDEMKKSTADPVNLPTEGGLQELMVAKQSVIATVRGGQYAGISIKVTNKKGGPDLGAIYRTGRVLRPTFGHGRFKAQTAGVKLRWMDPVFEAQKPEVKRLIEGALEEIARKVTNI